ncbi:MAG: MerR family DNA-binding transcriptional regulator [Desulfobacterales bacterium]
MKNRNSKNDYTISKLAEEFDITTRSIRYYEEKKLISPGRTKGNHRVYTWRDRARLKLILRGKCFGYSLEEIGELIGLTDVDLDEVDQLNKMLKSGAAKLQELRQRISDLQLLEQELISVGKKITRRLSELKKK